MRELYFTHLSKGAIGAIGFDFGMRGHIVEIIISTNFVTIGLGVLEF